MNCIMTFTKDIKLNSSIAEISSISLEHEYNVNEKIILGNFFVSGSFKPHELSINTENFSQTLPFDVILNDNVISESVKFTIDNFTYEVIDNKYLKINIDYLIEATEEEKEENIFEKVPDDFSKLFEDRIKEDEKEKEKIEKKVEVEEVREQIDDNSVDTIMSFASNNEETFVTYHIHVVKEEETLESISKTYNKSESDIMDYNKNVKYSVGEKILIPLDE